MNRHFARLALFAGIVAAGFVAGAAPAYRYAGFSLEHAFELMKWGVYAAGAAAVLALLWIVFSIAARSAEGLLSFVLALVLAAGAAYFPISMRMKAESLPLIHDITTNTENPPVFVAIAPLRADAPNGVDYKTDPQLQLGAYADIQPYASRETPAEVFKRAEATARAMNWEIVAAVPEEGRIEATDTTAWWGFKDDIVIKIDAATFTSTSTGAVENGAILNIRSMSRVGKSDLGKNAERIRAFLAAMEKGKLR
jgi:uncharacterized protein (DUF1499 family)